MCSICDEINQMKAIKSIEKMVGLKREPEEIPPAIAEFVVTEAMDMLKHTAGQNARDKGFHDVYAGVTKHMRATALLALIHSEVSEALEDVRKAELGLRFESSGKPVGLPSELADVIIRVADMAYQLDIDLGEAIIAKMKYNATREKMHGGKQL